MKDRFHENILKVIVVLLAIVIGSGISAEAASQVVWQIGKFDQSPEEFKMPKRRRMVQQPATEVVYIVGKSKPAEDWPAYQPASADKAGSPARPYTIQFELPQAPEGVYTLKVGLLSRSARVAQLRVEINGHPGLFYQHPKLNYMAGEWAGPADTIAFDFPARFLEKGTNKLALSAIYNAPPVDNDRNAGLGYDAIELDQDSAGKFPSDAVTADIDRKSVV